jgi:hypothetical protein
MLTWETWKCSRSLDGIIKHVIIFFKTIKPKRNARKIVPNKHWQATEVTSVICS